MIRWSFLLYAIYFDKHKVRKIPSLGEQVSSLKEIPFLLQIIIFKIHPITFSENMTSNIFVNLQKDFQFYLVLRIVWKSIDTFAVSQIVPVANCVFSKILTTYFIDVVSCCNVLHIRCIFYNIPPLINYCHHDISI